MYLEGVNSVLRHLGVEWIIFHTAQLLMYDQRIGHLVNSQNYRKQLIHDVITSLYYCGYPKQSAAVALMFGLR